MKLEARCKISPARGPVKYPKIEIENTPDEDSKIKMKDCIDHFKVLYTSKEMEYLAREYIKNNAIPDKYSEDAYHIAIAVLNEMDYILSWNFKHIVKEKPVPSSIW